jgi:hypothetical protein
VNPASTYRLCLYDASAAPQPLMETDVPTGGTCSGVPCWKALGVSGFRYLDKAGTSDGITSLLLKAGSAGRAKIQAKGRGANLGTPSFILSLPVTIQLVVDDGSGTECWQTTFTSAKINGGARFIAKGP